MLLPGGLPAFTTGFVRIATCANPLNNPRVRGCVLITWTNLFCLALAAFPEVASGKLCASGCVLSLSCCVLKVCPSYSYKDAKQLYQTRTPAMAMKLTTEIWNAAAVL